jgi:hypothetical protein
LKPSSQLNQMALRFSWCSVPWVQDRKDSEAIQVRCPREKERGEESTRNP